MEEEEEEEDFQEEEEENPMVRRVWKILVVENLVTREEETMLEGEKTVNRTVYAIM